MRIGIGMLKFKRWFLVLLSGAIIAAVACADDTVETVVQTVIIERDVPGETVVQTVVVTEQTIVVE